MTLTTAQMDGLLTPKDIATRNNCHVQCQGCEKWTPVVATGTFFEWSANLRCGHCGGREFDPTSLTSDRTFNPKTRRRPINKRSKRKEY